LGPIKKYFDIIVNSIKPGKKCFSEERVSLLERDLLEEKNEIST